MTEMTAEAAETILSNVEEGLVETVTVIQTNTKLLVGVGVLGLAAGAAGGYFFAKLKLKAKYEELVASEIEEAKTFYANLNKVDEDGKVLSPEAVFEKIHGPEAAEALRQYQGRQDAKEGFRDGEPHDVVEEDQIADRLVEEAKANTASEKKMKPLVEEEGLRPDPVLEGLKAESDAINVFTDVTFDLEEEKKYRTPDQPYIITHDEFFENEEENVQFTATYFEVDDVLVDEHDKPIDDINNTIGDDHLVRFGAGSRDKNVVYIRNERMGADFAVTRSKGSYLEEVLGMPNDEPDSLKHSDQRDRRQAFRRGEG